MQIGHIHCHGQGFTAGRSDDLVGSALRLGQVPVGDDHLRAAPGEGFCDGAANTAPSTGNQRYFTFKTHLVYLHTDSLGVAKRCHYTAVVSGYRVLCFCSQAQGISGSLSFFVWFSRFLRYLVDFALQEIRHSCVGKINQCQQQK